MVMEVSVLKAVAQAWSTFSRLSAALVHSGALDAENWSVVDKAEWAASVQVLGDHGLSDLVCGYFLDSLERAFKLNPLPKFWSQVNEFPTLKDAAKLNSAATSKLHDLVQSVLPRALAEISAAKSSQEDCLTVLLKVFPLDKRVNVTGDRASRQRDACSIQSQYKTSIKAILLTTAPKYFSEMLNLYFTVKLEQFSKVVKKKCSPHRSGDTDEDVEVLVDSTVDEDDEMESSRSSRASGGDDMDVNKSPNRKVRNQTPHGNEGMQTPAVGEFKPGVSTLLYQVIEVAGEDWLREVGGVVHHLRELGFASMSEEGYASAIYSLLKAKIHMIANKRYERPVLGRIRRWIEAVPLRFLCIVVSFSEASTTASSVSVPCIGPRPVPFVVDEVVNERVNRWGVRLQLFAFETLGDLRISELFEIIVDYPDSQAAVEDLKQCLSNIGDHGKLVESFRTALQQRLLTAGAATTDILLQYISTIKALRTLDPTGVVLEAVGEPVKEYLRGRKDTIRCIVTMLTDDTGPGGHGGLGVGGENLFEELSRGVTSFENADSEDDGDIDGDEAWAAAESWEPDPVDADPSRTSKSRRLMDIISMLVGIYGSKELFVNEYRVMLAEKLLNKTDYDTDRNIRTLELLKLRFGESNMHSCEIMLKDLADSKRINSNIKASISASNDIDGPGLVDTLHATARVPKSQPVQDISTSRELVTNNEQELSLDTIDATIISGLFWPPFQAETIKVPDVVEQLLDDYAKRYHTLKTPRKLQWKKHLGTVKLELQFEDRSTQFVVSPLHASIVMQFETRSSWLATELASAVGVPFATLRRRIMLWVNQGVVVESYGIRDSELVYTIVENLGDGGNRISGPSPAGAVALPLLGEEEGESAVASMEDQWQQEMNVFESYVVGMLTNFDSLALDRIHNMLKMFVSDPPYDKSLMQLQGFLSRLVSEEKLEVRDGLYRRRQ